MILRIDIDLAFEGLWKELGIRGEKRTRHDVGKLTVGQ